MEKIIDGKLISSKIKNELIKEIKKLDKKLKLVVIQVGDNPASDVYVKSKEKACQDVDIVFELLKYENIKEDDLINKIKELNMDKKVTSILVQLPLPSDINKDLVINKNLVQPKSRKLQLVE